MSTKPVSVQLPPVGSPEDDFPYKSRFISKSELHGRFRRLAVEYKPRFIHVDYVIHNLAKLPRDMLVFGESHEERQMTLLAFARENYELYDLLADYFTEPLRVRAERAHDSVYAEWCRSKEKVRQGALKQYGVISAYTEREVLFGMHYEVTSFRPTTLASLIQRFKGDRILDVCAGWGDRLVAALSQGVRLYVSVDANPRLEQYYKRIDAEFNGLVHKRKTETHFHISPFEDPRLDLRPYEKAGGFNFSVMAPPYYDLEVYAPDPQQSIYAHPSFEEWYRDFLIASIRKATSLLNVGGHFALIINEAAGDSDAPPYVERLVRDAGKIPWLEYLGAIPYAEVSWSRGKGGRVAPKPTHIRSPQPIWVYRKTKEQTYTER